MTADVHEWSPQCDANIGPPRRSRGSAIGFGRRCDYPAKYRVLDVRHRVAAGTANMLVCGLHARYYRETGHKVQPL